MQTDRMYADSCLFLLMFFGFAGLVFNMEAVHLHTCVRMGDVTGTSLEIAVVLEVIKGHSEAVQTGLDASECTSLWMASGTQSKDDTK